MKRLETEKSLGASSLFYRELTDAVNWFLMSMNTRVPHCKRIRFNVESVIISVLLKILLQKLFYEGTELSRPLDFNGLSTLQ